MCVHLCVCVSLCKQILTKLILTLISPWQLYGNSTLGDRRQRNIWWAAGTVTALIKCIAESGAHTNSNSWCCSDDNPYIVLAKHPNCERHLTLSNRRDSLVCYLIWFVVNLTTGTDEFILQLFGILVVNMHTSVCVCVYWVAGCQLMFPVIQQWACSGLLAGSRGWESHSHLQLSLAVRKLLSTAFTVMKPQGVFCSCMQVHVCVCVFPWIWTATSS